MESFRLRRKETAQSSQLRYFGAFLPHREQIFLCSWWEAGSLLFFRGQKDVNSHLGNTNDGFPAVIHRAMI